MSSGNAWDRQPGESARGHEAALEYFRLGAARSIDAVRQKFGKSARLCERWSAEHAWVDRAAAYDAHLADVEMRRRRELAEAQAAVWADREAKIRERRYTIAEQMLDKVELMLKTPLTRRKIKGKDLRCGSARCDWTGNGKDLEFPECPKCGSTDLRGGETVELVPAKWNMNTARLLASTASDLARMAIHDVDGDDSSEQENGAVYEFNNEDYKP